MSKKTEGITNLDKVEDPFGADPQVQDGQQQTGDGATQPETKSAEQNSDDLKRENAELKAKLAAAQEVRVVVQPQQQIQQQVPQMTADELQTQAESLGFTDPKQVESIGKIAAHVAAPAYQKAMILEQELRVERTVNAAKKQAQNADPQFSKLEPMVDEFLDSIPVTDKMDPDKLKGHMERAQFFAKGKLGISNQQQRRPNPTVQTRESDPDEGGGNAMKGPEVYQTPDGKTTLVVQPRVPDAIRKMHSHPAIEGGVQMDPKDEWRGPVFEKDLKKV